MKFISTRPYSPYILFFALLLFVSQEMNSQRRKQNQEPETPQQTVSDTLTADSVAPVKKQAFDDPVSYEANDSIVFFMGGEAKLYGKGKINYQTIELEAQFITLNMDSSTVHALGERDSVGVLSGTPIFKDGDTPYESEEMTYNFKTKKGYITNLITEQGEGYMKGSRAKKGANDEICMADGKYTTCDNHDHPHFYLQLTKAKVRPKKNVIFGPAYLVIEDLRLPIGVPFGFFPFTSSYSSGFIMPTYGDEMTRGFYLRDGGYYFAINDRVDLKVTGEIFTKGSWGIGAQSNYITRYKYSGNFSTNYLTTITGEKNLPDYSKSTDFRLSWAHRQDAKAGNNSSFSASVNFATSNYEKSNLDSYYNPALNATSTRTSSVSYTKSFPEQNISLSSTFNLAQNTRDSTLSTTLPDLNMNVSKIYPFKRKISAGDERWYEKISMSYTGQLSNSITTKEDLFFKSNLIKDWRNGIKHSIPVSATFTAFKYLNITPSFSYTERWYTHKINQSRAGSTSPVLRDTTYGFNRVYDYNMGVGMTTKLYGFYKPISAIFGDKVEAIRHVASPSLSFTYAPDFGARKYGYQDLYSYTDTLGNVQTVNYNPYEGSLFGVPGKGKQGMINFALANNLEMKIKSDRDTTGYRKISLIDDLSTSLGYNMAAAPGVFRWTDIPVNMRLKLSKSYTLSLNTTFATQAYQLDEKGSPILSGRTEWIVNKRLGRFLGTGTSFNYTFNNQTYKKLFGKKETDKTNKSEAPDQEAENTLTEENVGKEGSLSTKKEEAEGNQPDADGYLPFAMPWSLNFSYSFNYRENRSGTFNTNSMAYPLKLVHTLSFGGNVALAKRWGFNFSSSYDFDAKEIATTSCTITRDLHCWGMSCSLVPFGRYTSYSFSIRANSSMLQDLKWEQRSSTNTNVKWY